MFAFDFKILGIPNYWYRIADFNCWNRKTFHGKFVTVLPD